MSVSRMNRSRYYLLKSAIAIVKLTREGILTWRPFGERQINPLDRVDRHRPSVPADVRSGGTSAAQVRFGRSRRRRELTEKAAIS